MKIKQKLHHLLFFIFPRSLELYIQHFRKTGINSSHYKDKVLFIHIPKVAGTSLNKAIYLSSYSQSSHFTANEFKLRYKDSFDKVYKCAVVRHPFERFVSAYKFYINGGTEKVKVNPYSYLIVKKNNIVELAYDLKKKIDHAKVDKIFSKQVEYLFDEHGKICVDYVGQLNNLDGLVKELAPKLEREIVIGNSNVSSNEDFFLNDIDLFELEKVVYEIYKDDYIKLGFETKYYIKYE